jgi:aerobic-type carbon monoxide dehydrogenase small subunit (CoxS/CutS family)
MTTLTINGQSTDVDASSDTPLLWVIRDHLGMTGTKFGCGVAACGACTVLLEGQPVRSCVVPLSAAAGQAITTIEGIADGDKLHPVQQAWIDHQVPQCGYCQSGMILATVALLKNKPQPSDNDINQTITNICRCGTYPRVRKAIHALAGNSTEVKS